MTSTALPLSIWQRRYKNAGLPEPQLNCSSLYLELVKINWNILTKLVLQNPSISAFLVRQKSAVKVIKLWRNISPSIHVKKKKHRRPQKHSSCYLNTFKAAVFQPSDELVQAHNLWLGLQPEFWLYLILSSIPWHWNYLLMFDYGQPACSRAKCIYLINRTPASSSLMSPAYVPCLWVPARLQAVATTHQLGSKLY